MKIQKFSLAVLAAGGLFAFSTVAQAADTNAVTAPKENTPPAAAEGRARGPGGRGFSVDAQMERLNQALTLTDDQKPKVKTVLEDQNKKMTELRSLSQEDRRAKLPALREETTKKMKEILTAEQFEKYEKLGLVGGRRGQGGQGGGNGGGNPPPQQ